MSFKHAPSIGGDHQSDHALTIAFLYPRWEPGRRSYSLDVLGYGLASDIQQPDRAVMLARGPGKDPDAPIRFLVGPIGHQLARVAATVDRWSKALGVEWRVRPFTRKLSPHKSYGAGAARAVAQMDADVAHVFIYDKLVPLVAEAAPRTKIILHMHDHAQRRTDRDEVAANLEMCDLVVGCSDYLSRAAAARFPEFGDKIVAIPNSIPHMLDPSNWEHRRDIVFSGRLSPEKGVHILIGAFESIAHRYPETNLVLVGPQSVPGREVFETQQGDPVFEEAWEYVQSRASGYAAHLESLIPAELRSRVRFAGEIPNDQVTMLIRDAAVLALPSIWQEPFGLPALEASAVGVPAVVTRSGALPEIIEDGHTGLVVERNEVDQLARALSTLLEDPLRASEMGRAGARRARKEFGWSRYVDSWNRAYHSLAD